MPDETPQDEQRGVGANAAEGLRNQLKRIERLLDPGLQALTDAEERFLAPAWRQVTEGEPRWPVSVAILAAIALQISLPNRVAFHPRWLLPALQALLLIGVVVVNPKKIDRESRELRGATTMLIAVISIANAWSAGHLVRLLLRGTEHLDATRLLTTGGAIWLTNVLVFALWYWHLDRGGPVARAHATDVFPDFLFAQMQSPELAPPGWESGFVDYLFLSFTNATAFSPTDVLPLSRGAKLGMMLQSGVSLMTVALVIARAVNILR